MVSIGSTGIPLLIALLPNPVTSAGVGECGPLTLAQEGALVAFRHSEQNASCDYNTTVNGMVV